MDPLLSALGALVAMLFAALSYFVRDALTSSKETAKDLSAFKLEVAKNYVSTTEAEATEERIMGEFRKIEVALERIFDRLESKADK